MPTNTLNHSTLLTDSSTESSMVVAAAVPPLLPTFTKPGTLVQVQSPSWMVNKVSWPDMREGVKVICQHKQKKITSRQVQGKPGFEELSL